LRAQDAGSVAAELQAVLDSIGVEAFVAEEVPALNRWIGHSWVTGEIQVYEEHLYSDSVIRVLRGAIAALESQVRPEAPQVLLTTFPGEGHAIGLLLAQTMFAMQGCPTVFLGVNLPIAQIVGAAHAYGADLVGLSFSASYNPSQLVRGLEELRGLLAPRVKIWAGGDNAGLQRRRLPGVRAVTDAKHMAEYLAEDFALPPRG
jgi:methanogenic corrinoid protein MtbC1